MIQLKRSPIIIDAEKFVKALYDLAHQYPDQPVALIANDDGGIKVGVLNLLPEEADWCLTPVAPETMAPKVKDAS